MKIGFHFAVSAATALALCLGGCATPITTLKSPTTGQVVQCGGGGVAGSIAGGLVGYSIEKSSADSCVNNYKAAGFIPFYPGYEPATRHSRLHQQSQRIRRS